MSKKKKKEKRGGNTSLVNEKLGRQTRIASNTHDTTNILTDFKHKRICILRLNTS